MVCVRARSRMYACAPHPAHGLHELVEQDGVDDLPSTRRVSTCRVEAESHDTTGRSGIARYDDLPSTRSRRARTTRHSPAWRGAMWLGPVLESPATRSPGGGLRPAHSLGLLGMRGECRAWGAGIWPVRGAEPGGGGEREGRWGNIIVMYTLSHI